MDRIQAMKIFLRVVEANSFVRAAESLSLPASSVTGMVKALEQHLQVRLLNRTTRNLSLTPEGENYLLRCQEIIDLIEHTERSLTSAKQAPQGRLRVDMPSGIAHAVVLPQLRDFQHRYPNIYLNIGVNDRQIDLIQDGVDCVIRTGALEDSALVARRIGQLQWVTCAAPTYLARFGTPTQLEDLTRHQSIHYFSNTARHAGDFHFLNNNASVTLTLDGAIATNETELYIKLCRDGFGLAQMAEVLIADRLQSAELVEVLAEFRPATVPISLVYPHQKFISPTLHAFTNWITGLFLPG